MSGVPSDGSSGDFSAPDPLQAGKPEHLFETEKANYERVIHELQWRLQTVTSQLAETNKRKKKCRVQLEQ